MVLQRLAEKWDRFLISTGKVLRVLFWAVAALVVWSLKPDSIADTPFSQLTFNKLFGTLYWIAALIFCGYAVFNPSVDADEESWRAWGKYGIIGIVLLPFVLPALVSCSK